jgi:hypothetical protein
MLRSFSILKMEAVITVSSVKTSDFVHYRVRRMWVFYEGLYLIELDYYIIN